jgi:hypothetical protein
MSEKGERVRERERGGGGGEKRDVLPKPKSKQTTFGSGEVY